jgi:chromosome segregation ATPase
MTLIELIATGGSGFIAAVGGPATVRFITTHLFKKSARAIEASVQIEKEREVTARHRLDLDVKLEGTTQQQVIELQQWMRLQLEKLQAVNDERDDLEDRCLAVIDQGTDLRVRLEAKDLAVSRLQLEVAQLQTRIVELTAQLEGSVNALARIEDENAYLRARGGTERF